MATVKVLKKLCAQIQSGGTYESGGMYRQPFTSETLSQMYDMIDDESISGEGFKEIPQQGPRHTEGTVTQTLDDVACIPILEAAFGANSSGVFTLGSNSKKLSMCGLNDANAIQYANVYISRLRLFSSVSSLWQMEYDIIGETAQVRTTTGSYPTDTGYDDPFTFHETGGTGFVRIGDTADALDSGDEINIEEFSLELTTGFDSQYCNEGTGTLTPAFGMVAPTVTGSMKVSRHTSDAFQDFEDANTPLQATIYIYKSATSNILIEIPRFVISCTVTDDDIARQDLELMIGRNGTGTNYKNTNMSFTSPVRITVTNS